MELAVQELSEADVFKVESRGVCIWNTMPKILQAAAAVTQVPIEFVRDSDNRDQRAVYARHLAMYIACYEYGMSTPAVARRIGKKDHTTVLHGVNKIERIKHIKPDCSKHLQQVSGIVRGHIPQPTLVPMDETWGVRFYQRQARERANRKPKAACRPIVPMSPDEVVRAASVKLCDLMRHHHPSMATPVFSTQGAAHAR
jgi:hypothetical protein